jgi:hypothetical protein
MAARQRTHQEIIDLLGRAVGHASQAETYHAAARDPRALEESASRQAARDAGAMQLIELHGCAERFTVDRGDPGTTLARFDDALRPVITLRHAHVHPEIYRVPAAVTSRGLAGKIEELKTAIGNLDSETLRIEAPDQKTALNAIIVGLLRIERDGLPDAEKLRPRDLHYAGYYHEIQFGRLAKATGLYVNKDKSPDPRLRDINASISDADDMAHRFHELRSGFDKSILPVSVVSPQHRERVPGRSLSELMRELRHEQQTPAERGREEHRDAVEALAATGALITWDPGVASAIRDYADRREPRLDTKTLRDMQRALEIAASPDGDYLAEVPQAVQDRWLLMCIDLKARGDGLVDILSRADGQSAARRAIDQDRALVRSEAVDDPQMDIERGPGRGR